jgi:hypothetical protein
MTGEGRGREGEKEEEEEEEVEAAETHPYHSLVFVCYSGDCASVVVCVVSFLSHVFASTNM